MTADRDPVGPLPSVDPGQPADGADAAGASPAAGEVASPDAPAAPAPPARRASKLVVTCTPQDGDAYRAVLVLGADGCDPQFRMIAADGLIAALDEVPALVAEAEERWRTQPRYPAASRPRANATRQRADAAKAQTPNEQAPVESPAPAAPRPQTAPAAKPAGTGQLALFG